MDAILGLMPEEERIQYSAMKGQSLYYLGERCQRSLKTDPLLTYIRSIKCDPLFYSGKIPERRLFFNR